MKPSRTPLIVAVVVLLVHLIGNPHYGFFRDELYFIACGFHPDWGYVDQPPVVPLLAAGSQLFGHSLFLLRAVAALFAAAGAYVTCLLAIELGGGVFAQILAGLAFLFAGVLMSFGMKVGPDMTGLWLWPLIALYALRIARGGDPRQWLFAGIAAGVAIESKYSALLFLAALIGGLLLTPQRRSLASGWFWAGAALALLVALPNALWQALHGFPMLELLRNGQNGKNVVAGPALYLFQQLLLTNLFLSPIWIVGLIALLCDRSARFLGYAYVLLIALMIVLHGKHYYPGDVYPIPIAAGAVAVARWTRGLPAVRVALAAAAVAAGLFFLPFSLPVLPERTMARYDGFVKRLLHVNDATLATERHRTAALPADWADMHGWPELTATVARVYRNLPPPQRAVTAIVASNYGEAAAIDFFGKAYGLPPAISGHNNYWLWGAHGATGAVVIDVNGDCGAAAHAFRTSTLAARFGAPWVISYEQDIPIRVCTGPVHKLSAMWPSMRNYI